MADLISFADDNKKMTENRRQPAQRDSFSDLTGLMKAKKPYTPIPPPTPKPQLSLATNGMQFVSRNTSDGSLHSPVARPFQAPESIAAFLHDRIPPLIPDLDPPTPVEPIQATSPAIQPVQNLTGADHDVAAQLGKLRYQNEANKDQKSAMGRSIGLKNEEIKNLQLDNEDLRGRLSEVESKLKKLAGVKGELEYLRGIKSSTEAEDHASHVRELEEQLKHVTAERDKAVRGQIDTSDHVTRAQNLADTLVKREKMITDLRQKHLEEQLKVTDLEDEVEALRGKINQENIDDLKAKLRDKKSQCDQQRNQLKLAELHLKASQDRVLRVANDGESLRGAAHLVAPNPNGKLPKSVIACSECYAYNLTCDSNTICRSCTERNAKCCRWRCSLKHRLGDCPMAPCKLPHDPQGWLVLQEPRPQW